MKNDRMLGDHSRHYRQEQDKRRTIGTEKKRGVKHAWDVIGFKTSCILPYGGWWATDCTWKRMENLEDAVHEGAMIRGGPGIATFVCTIIPVPPCWLPPAMNFKAGFAATQWDAQEPISTPQRKQAT
jgi:hypothetical protein